MPHFWKYDKVDVRDDIADVLKGTSWTLNVYKTVSGDSGKIYYVQILTAKYGSIYICNCPEGIFKAPLSILGLGMPCKHAEHLAEFLKERKS